MTDEWIERRLRDVTTKIGSGATPLGGEKAYKSEGISLIRSLNVHDSGFRVKDLAFIDETQAAKLDNAEVILGDVLLNITGASIARCCLAPEDLLPARVNQHVSILRPVQSELLPELLHYMLISSMYKDRLLHAGEGGATRQALTKAQLQDFVIHFPKSLTEQRRIVGILDEAFAGIAVAKRNAEQNLQNARALFESHLQAIFTQRGDGWGECKLREICDVKHGFAFKSEHFTSRGDYVMLTPGNFYETGGYRNRGDKQKYYCGEIPAGYILDQGDLLVAMTEQAAGLLGSPILVPEDNRFLHNQRLGLVVKKTNVPWTNEFFFHVFNTTHVRREIHDSATGVKVRHTSPSKIGEVCVSFPASVRTQQAIVRQLDELKLETQRLAALYQQKLTALDELKKSLLARAFAGELASAAVA